MYDSTLGLLITCISWYAIRIYMYQLNHILFQTLTHQPHPSPHSHAALGILSLRWRHNGRDGVSNHQPYHCLLNRLFGCRSKKTSQLSVTGLCAGNSLGTGEFPAQMASNAENVSIRWRHRVNALAHGHLIDIPENNYQSNFSDWWLIISLMKLPLDKCHWILLMISQLWFR